MTAEPTTKSAVEAERRQLTIMFCDLVDSTGLSQRLDAEDVREIVESCRTAWRVAIERYDGYIARYMGDGVLVYFGYPLAHEDDAERAIRAGIGVVDATRRLSEGLALKVEPAVHVLRPVRW